jgi:hypothetical protein
MVFAPTMPAARDKRCGLIAAVFCKNCTNKIDTIFALGYCKNRANKLARFLALSPA